MKIVSMWKFLEFLCCQVILTWIYSSESQCFSLCTSHVYSMLIAEISSVFLWYLPLWILQDFRLMNSLGRNWTWLLRSWPRKRRWLTHASPKYIVKCLLIYFLLNGYSFDWIMPLLRGGHRKQWKQDNTTSSAFLVFLCNSYLVEDFSFPLRLQPAMKPSSTASVCDEFYMKDFVDWILTYIINSHHNNFLKFVYALCLFILDNCLFAILEVILKLKSIFFSAT